LSCWSEICCFGESNSTLFLCALFFKESSNPKVFPLRHCSLWGLNQFAICVFNSFTNGSKQKHTGVMFVSWDKERFWDLALDFGLRGPGGLRPRAGGLEAAMLGPWAVRGGACAIYFQTCLAAR
jgi:hypothetical protein